MALTIFTWLCNHHYHPSSEHFITPKWSSVPINDGCPSPHPLSLAITVLFSVCINLPTLGTSHKWNPHRCPFVSGLFHFSIMSSRFVRVVAGVRISFCFKAEWYSVVCLDLSLFVHLLIDGWVAPTFWLVNNAAMSMGVHISFWVPAFVSFG